EHRACLPDPRCNAGLYSVTCRSSGKVRPSHAPRESRSTSPEHCSAVGRDRGLPAAAGRPRADLPREPRHTPTPPAPAAAPPAAPDPTPPADSPAAHAPPTAAETVAAPGQRPATTRRPAAGGPAGPPYTTRRDAAARPRPALVPLVPQTTAPTPLRPLQTTRSQAARRLMHHHREHRCSTPARRLTACQTPAVSKRAASSLACAAASAWALARS